MLTFNDMHREQARDFALDYHPTYEPAACCPFAMHDVAVSAKDPVMGIFEPSLPSLRLSDISTSPVTRACVVWNRQTGTTGATAQAPALGLLDARVVPSCPAA